MAFLLASNNARTTIAGPISSGALTVNLAAGTGSLFPVVTVGTYFELTFNDAATGLLTEIVFVTARTGDTLTITRGQEGTTARAWVVGDIASNFWTAGLGGMGAMIQIAQLQQQQTNFAFDVGSANNYVIAMSPAPPTLAYLTGVPIRVLIGNTNTGSSVLTVNGLAATLIKNPGGSNLSAGQLPAFVTAVFIYNGSNFQLVSPTAYVLLNRINAWLQTNTFSAGVVDNGFDSGGLNFRMVGGTYGSGWRNDGASSYILFTDTGNPLGTFNALRPLSINNSTGHVTIDQTGAGVSVGGTTTFGVGAQVFGGDLGGMFFRMASGAFGSGFRNDGAFTYLMLSNSGDPLGNFNSLRPIVVNNATGAVQIDGTGAGVTFGGNVTAAIRMLSVFGASGTGNGNVLTNLNDFPSFISPTSFSLTLPTGLVIQGMATGIVAQTLMTLNFPTAFPNICVSVVGNIGINFSPTVNAFGVASQGINGSRTQFNAMIATAISSGAVDEVSFIMVGW